ncbi:MAG: hypothetical protein KBC64_07965, partial [Simkaniaceae bacterium]|nr:hypothetical protein [Simkaniaceae bacterium]
KLPPEVRTFLQEIHLKVFDAYLGNIGYANKLACLFVENQSIFDYIHERLQSGLELDPEAVKSLNLERRAISDVSLTLLQMFFVRIAKEPDPEKVEQLLLSLPINIKTEFFNKAKIYWKDCLAAHFSCFLEFVPTQEKRLAFGFELVSLKGAYLKHLHQFHLDEPTRIQLLVKLYNNPYGNKEFIDYLSFFDISDTKFLLKIITDLSFGYQARALKSAKITDSALIYPMIQTLLCKNEDLFFRLIDDYPIDKKTLDAWKMAAIKCSKNPGILEYLFKEGELIYPESFLIEILNDHLAQTRDELLDRTPSILSSIESSLGQEKKVPLMSLVWKETEALVFAFCAKKRVQYLRQVSYASSLIPFVSAYGDVETFTAFFTKDNEFLLHLTQSWRLLDQKTYLASLQRGMELFSLGYQNKVPPYVFEHLLPAIANHDSAMCLRFIFDTWQKNEFISLLNCLQYTHPDIESGLSVEDMVTAMKPHLKTISAELWSHLKTWNDISNLETRYAAFRIGKSLIQIEGMHIPEEILRYVVPAIAKCRNKDLAIDFTSRIQFLIRQPKELNTYQTLISGSAGEPPLAHCILPMLLLSKSRDTTTVLEIKKLFHPLRRAMRDVDTGLSQAIQMAALNFIKLPWTDDIQYLKRALELNSIQQIKTALSHLQFLNTYDKMDQLNASWDLDLLTALVRETWREVFGIDPAAIDNFDERFATFFNSPRMAGKLEMYATKQEDSLKPLIGEFIHSALTETFDLRRYDTTHSPHLQKLQEEHPEIYRKWQEITVPIPLIKQREAHRVTEDFVRVVFLNAAEHHHLGDYRIQETLEACGDNLIEQLIFQLMHEPPHFQKIQALIDALTALPIPPELLNDVKGLRAAMQPQRDVKDLQVLITDDPRDMFLCGTEVPGSCQRVDGDPRYSQCLLSYVLDGKNKLIAIKDSEEKIVARRIFRLLFDEKGNPALFLEKHYGRSEAVIQQAILDQAVACAASLHLPLYIQESLEDGLPSSTTLNSLGSSAPTEYVDAVRGVTNGVYSLETTMRLLTQPIDHDLATLHQALSVRNSIPYTQAIHDAAYCMNEKLSSDKWGNACRAYIAQTGDSFSYNGKEPVGRITQPKQL